jgi:GTP-binding protein
MPGTPAPSDAYRIIRTELAKYSPKLAAKRELVVANKMDLTDAPAHVQELRNALGEEVLGVSAATGDGLPAMAERLWAVLAEAKAEPEETSETVKP